MILAALRIIYHRRVSIRGWIERALHPRVCKPRRDKLRCVRLTEDTFLPRRGSPPPLVTSLNWRTRSIEKGSTRRSRGRGFVAIYRPYNALHIEQGKCVEALLKEYKHLDLIIRDICILLFCDFFRLYLNSFRNASFEFWGKKVGEKLNGILNFEWKSV